ncbi:MAG: AAA family ATPase [Acidobacteria bacterium]|nr:AAA family ATPase [Acidobacteriota bacterium]
MESVDRAPRILTSEELAWTCPESWLSFQTTAEVSEERDLVGQHEAVAALRLGIRLRAPGYNIFVAGLPGTGRTTTVRRLLADESRNGPVPDDLVYVYSPAERAAPTPLFLPAGKGRVLKSALIAAQIRFRDAVTGTRASHEHRSRREAVARGSREQQAKLVAAFQELVAAEGFALVAVEAEGTPRHEIAPVVGGRARGFGRSRSTGRGGRAVGGGRGENQERTSGAGRTTRRRLERSEKTGTRDRGRVDSRGSRSRAPADGRDRARDPREARPRGGRSPRLRCVPCVADGLVLGNVPGHVWRKRTGPLRGDRDFRLAHRHTPGVPGQRARGSHRLGGRPVVEESHPSVARLLGALDVQRAPDGTLRADLLGLRAGALHRAHGGYLIINALELIEEDGAWMALRRALRSGEVGFRIGQPEDGPPPLAPKRAPLDVTVILVGPLALRDRFVSGDPDFDKLFKVVALFEDRVELTREAGVAYACFVARLATKEGLLPFHRQAVGRMIEEMVRIAGGSRKISTRYRILADIAREASFAAHQASASMVEESHVGASLDARRDRASALSKRIFESIRNDVLHLEFEGNRVGQVNALAVVETSLETFGYPVRLTATASVGRSGIIDIEREAELAGEIHTKASLILAGYLRSLFAQDAPLSITASICFEQSYGGVEGDSASAAELVALLSAIAGVPIRQDVAVTGAVDQRGQILAVGGVNEKIEGFWRACRSRGLSGTQGVVIPEASTGTLQLDPRVVHDVNAGRFFVRCAESVPALLYFMTGVPFGTRASDGSWSENSFGALVSARLRSMADAMRIFGGANG